MPWLEALVFLSDPEIQVDLPGAARNRVAVPDREPAEGRAARKGILAALINREVAGRRAGLPGRDRQEHRRQARPGAGPGRHPALAEGPAGRRLRAQAADRREPRRLPGPARRARGAAGGLLPGPAVPGRPGDRRGGAPADEAGGGPRVPDPPELRPPRHPRRPRLQGPRVRPGPAVRLRAAGDAAGPLPGDPGAEADARAPGWSWSARSPTRSATRTPRRSSTGRWPRRASWSWTPTPRSPGSRCSTGRSGSARPRPAPAPRSTSSELVDRLATAYMAPEALLDPKGGDRGVRRLLAGGDRLPPLLGPVARREPGRGGADAGGARGPAGLRRARRRRAEAGGADPAGAPTPTSTSGSSRRPTSSSWLDDVEDELTDPEEHPAVDPASARKGRPARGGLRRSSGSSARGPRGSPCWSTGATRRPCSRSPATPDDDDRLRRGGRGAQEGPQRVHRRPPRGQDDRRPDGPGARQVGRRDAGRAAPQGGPAGAGAAPAVRRGPAPGGRLAGAARGGPPRHQARQHRRPLGQAAAATGPVRLLAVAGPARPDPGRHAPLPRPVPRRSAGRPGGTPRPSGTRRG